MDVLFDVVSDPARWVGGRGLFDPVSASGAVGMLGWASTGMTSTEASLIVGKIAPWPFVEWVWCGWSPMEILAWRPQGDWVPEEAGTYRDVGFSPDAAGVWRRNAKDLHPRTALALADGGWSASGAAKVRKVAERVVPGLEFASWWDIGMLPYPSSGDVLLQEWSQVDQLSASQVALCLRAGLSFEEVAARLGAGTMDWVAVRTLAALRA